MGKAALEGLQGVTRVERGFSGWQETNTVYYDPDTISEKDLVRVLKEVQTYLGTAK